MAQRKKAGTAGYFRCYRRCLCGSKKWQDLKEVFNQFYNIIYSTETINIADTVIPENGELEVPFDDPGNGCGRG